MCVNWSKVYNNGGDLWESFWGILSESIRKIKMSSVELISISKMLLNYVSTTFILNIKNLLCGTNNASITELWLETYGFDMRWKKYILVKVQPCSRGHGGVGILCSNCWDYGRERENDYLMVSLSIKIVHVMLKETIK